MSALNIIRFSLAISFLVCVSSATAVTYRHDRSDAYHVRLGASAKYASVGRWNQCSGTIVNRTGSTGIVLTAAHCVGGTLDEFRLGNRSFPVIEATVHPKYSENPTDFNIAVLRIANTDAATPFSPLYRGRSELGRTAVLVGLGQGGTGVTGGVGSGGTKRAAQNVIHALAWPGQENRGRLLIADFTRPDSRSVPTGSSPALRYEGFPTVGDSGGGVFIDFGRGPELVGVITELRGKRADVRSGYGDEFAAIRISRNLAFINGVIDNVR